ncbi:MAG TPA: hypothetical protein VIJ94_10320 [Caulobacteraceae bacterium]
MTSHLLRKLLVPIAIAAMLAGCATQPLIPPSTQVVVAEGVTTMDAAYNVVAKSYLKQAPTMAAAKKAQAKPLLAKIYQLISAIDAGETLGTSTSMADQITQATQLIAQAKSLLGVK